MKVNKAALLAAINRCENELIEVSVDVSTCDDDAGLRAFVYEVIAYDSVSGILFLGGELNDK